MIDAPQISAPPPPKPSVFRQMNPVLFAILALVIVFVLYQIVAGGIAIIIAHGSITKENAGLVRTATAFGQILCILLPTLVLVKLRAGVVIPYVRLKLPDIAQMVVTVVAVFALQQVLQGYQALQDAIPLPAPVEHIVRMVKKFYEETYTLLLAADNWREFAIVVVVAALVPAICEEFLFRGLVQRSFEEVAGGLRGALITGVIFGAYHLNPFGVVPLIVLGGYFGFIVYRSQNLSLSIIVHFFNNFIACAAVYLQLNDDFLAVAPSSHPTVALQVANTLIFAAVFLAATYSFMRLTDHVHSGEMS